MRDGLSRNAPKGHSIRDCSCNVHARRNFVDIQAVFPEDSQRVVQDFSKIYRVEAQARAKGLDPQQRLQLHQEQSQPVMEQLKSHFTQSLESRRVEPNSNLGQAMNYLLKRWAELTQFLRIPGAPLDNNVTERLLKTAILHRKNSLHYRTVRGAAVGDLFMSLLQTCFANGADPFDYLLTAARNADAVKLEPGRWMPWNYKEALVPDATSLSG